MFESFVIWQNPKTGEHRVYVHGLPQQGKADIWFQKEPFGNGYDVLIASIEHNTVEKINLSDRAFDAVTSKTGRKIQEWQELLSAI